ncbi:DNA/RNA helicase domain-containing protein [Gemmatimonas sp.]|uniref:DNA/RNA helicase domain-containing protein n=1 Tax=Gemmatimonas sp. TaxID=1962908 RepID=UPI003568397F
MIEVSGEKGSEEFRAAENLAELARTWLPSLASSPEVRMWLVAGAQCYGSEVQDVDIIMFGAIPHPCPTAISADAREAEVESFVVSFEVKTHGPGAVQFEGTRVSVRYGTDWKDATKQAGRQVHSFRDYVKRRGQKPPFIVDLIWLVNVPSRDLPPPPHNILGADASFTDVMNRLWDSRFQPRVIEQRAVFSVGAHEQIRAVVQLFTKGLTPSALDRRRMEMISQRWLDDQQYASQVGQRMLIVRGRAGTGKTVALLRMGYDLYRDRGGRVLFLTYNNALVADVRRLLALLKLRSGFDTGDITIRTVHGFVLDLARELLGLGHARIDVDEDYDRIKAELLDIIALMEDADRVALRKAADRRFDWDHLLIDEAQDWPEDERQILFGVYGSSSLIVADGVDQFVRSAGRLDWARGLGKDERQIVSLKKVRRLKLAIFEFLQVLTKLLDLEPLDIVADYEAHGGRVIIVEGEYLSNPELHREVVVEHARAGNEPVDMLFCVTERHVQQDADGSRRSIVADRLATWGEHVWDGVDRHERKVFPVRLDQFRVVQYDSCRGLEGWTVVCLGFDKLYALKRERFTPDENDEHRFTPQETRVHEHAARWLMLAVTRAIDTLVLEVAPDDGYIKSKLVEAAKACGETVDWVKL